MEFGEKIKAIREVEGLKQSELSELTGIGIKTLQNYEQGVVKNYNVTVIQKITNHERFKDYTAWLMDESAAGEPQKIDPISYDVKMLMETLEIMEEQGRSDEFWQYIEKIKKEAP